MVLILKLAQIAPLLLLAVKVTALPPAPAHHLASRGGAKPATAESPRQVIRVEAPAGAAAAAGRAYFGPPNGNGNATLTIPHADAVDGDDAAARRDRDRQRDLRKVNVAHRPAAARNEKPSPSGPDAPPTDDTSATQPGGINHPRATGGGCHQKRDNPAKHNDDDFAAMLASRAGAATKTATTTTKFRSTPNPRVSRDSIAAFLAASYEQHYGRKLSSTSGEGEGGGAPIKVKEGAGLKGPASKKSVEAELQRSYEEHFRHAPGKGKGHKGEEV